MTYTVALKISYILKSNFWDPDSALKQGGFYIQGTCETNKKFQSFWSKMLSLSLWYCAQDICFVLIETMQKKKKKFSCFFDAFTCRQRHEFMHEYGLDLDRNLVHSRFSLNCQGRSDLEMTWCHWKKFLSGVFGLVAILYVQRIAPNVELEFSFN